MNRLTRVVERHCALLNAHRVDDVLELYHSDCRIALPTGGAVGREDFGEFHRAMALAFPDLRWDVVRMVEAGDTIAAELRFSGTNTGPFCTGVNELPPTGTHIAYQTCDLVTLRDGKIAEWCTYFDQVALFGQLGWM